MMRKYRLLPGSMYLAIGCTLGMNAIAYYGSRMIAGSWHHYDMTTWLDRKVPVMPWTILIYFGCYALWVTNYILGCRQDREKAFQFISADFFAKIICMVCFLVLPTTNIRPCIAGNGVFEQLLLFLYRIDAADNLFPSIHCLTSWFSYLAVRENPRVPKWYKHYSLLFAILVCLSTLTTAQHVIADVIAGVALAQFSYIFVGKSGFAKWYQNILERISREGSPRECGKEDEKGAATKG